jgi:hypothetical protein
VQNDSVPVDYLGLALTEEGRARALAYDESQKSMIERQCQGWGASYVVLGPFGLRVSTQSDPATNRVVSYTIGAWEDWNGMIIWMDGRPHPSEHASTRRRASPRPLGGGALAAHTTHMKAGFIRKTGVPLTDQATIDWRFLPARRRADGRDGGARPGVPRRARDRLEELPALADAARLRDPCVTGFEARSPATACPTSRPTRTRSLDEFVKLFTCLARP